MAARARARAFCEAYGLRLPVIMAPMAGACPPKLAAAVAGAGGMGACGATPFGREGVERWVAEFRQLSTSSERLLLNLWTPDPAPARDEAVEAPLRSFLAGFGPAPDRDAGGRAWLPPFDEQCEAVLAARPTAVSSIMGLYPVDFAARLRAARIPWWATVTTVAEARAAVDAGCDVLCVQGVEAGGHSGCFEARAGIAESRGAGLLSLVPAVVDAAPGVPVVAAGGIADARGVAAALALGASAVQVGTGLLRAPEAAISPAWRAAIAGASPEDTVRTRAFTGRLGRGIANAYVAAAHAPSAPAIAPFPIQRGLTAPMRAEAASQDGDIDRLQAWAGQSARLAEAKPAGEIVADMWRHAESMIV